MPEIQRRSAAVQRRGVALAETKRLDRSKLLSPVAPPGATMSIGFTEEFDLAALQERLRKMSDEQLLSFGRAARDMCSPDASLGQPPRECFVIQLREAKAEWRRRKSNLQ